MISASELAKAFPDVNPGVKPLGARVLIQLRTVRVKTASGIVLVEDTRTFNKAAGLMGKVIALGPIAFCNRESGLPWREGVWAEPGQFVRIPKYGGERFERVIPGTGEDGETAAFCIFSDHELIALVEPEAFEELDEIL